MAVFVLQWQSRIVVTEAAWIAKLQKYLLFGPFRTLLTAHLAECLLLTLGVVPSQCQINRLILFLFMETSVHTYKHLSVIYNC